MKIIHRDSGKFIEISIVEVIQTDYELLRKSGEFIFDWFREPAFEKYIGDE